MLELLATPAVSLVFTAILGLIVGSFLNVVILRLPARLLHDWRAQSRELLELAPDTTAAPPGIVNEPSHCPKCKHTLGGLENLPLLSWLALRGRCRHCGARISVRYPLIEALSCLASIVIMWRFGFGWQAAAGLALTWALIALAGIDLRAQLLPDQITLPLLWLGLLLSLAPVFIDGQSSILGAALGYLSLWAIYWLFRLVTGKEGMGYGDFKLLGALGAWMGPFALLPITLIASLIGALIGGAALALEGRDRATPIPFGPFLAVAGWAEFAFGAEIAALYQHWFVEPLAALYQYWLG
jgi:leader peptidase (prepilin peptidase)/N-methyltransferase